MSIRNTRFRRLVSEDFILHSWNHAMHLFCSFERALLNLRAKNFAMSLYVIVLRFVKKYNIKNVNFAPFI